MEYAPAIGLASGTVRVVAYDERWPGLYAAEATRLSEILSAHGLFLRLEHSGSTAVPGLAAKPIIDILGGRGADDSRQRVIEAIIAAGYIYRGEQGIIGRDFFRRGELRSYHLHVTELGSDFWHDHLAFRDHLRSNVDALIEYQELKQALARRYPFDRESYIEGKTAFVTRITRLARWGDPGV